MSADPGPAPRLSFRAKLLVSYVALVAFVVLLASFELNRSLGADLVRQLDARLEAQAEGAAQWIGSGRHPNRLAGRLASVVGAEITLLDRDGAVVGYADPRSDPQPGVTGESVPDPRTPDLPGQNDQPEVILARERGRGHATRAPSPSGEAMRYVAVATADGHVLRLGVPLAGIEATLRAMRYRLLFAAVLAMAAAVVLGLGASRVLERLTSERDRLSALLAQVRRLEVVRRDFVANVSHELRTPVTAIQGYAETLLETRPDEPTRERFLATIHRHAQRLGRLLEDLLRLSAIESQSPEGAVREPVPLRALAMLVAQTVEERRREKGATIDIDVPDTAVARGDPAGVEQVLENLVDNALKYGPAGVHVRVAAERAGASVRVTVTDDGPGIAAEHLPRIFERFYRVDPARSREQGGAGLGLAIVKHLVESMNGAVTATSEPGKGCQLAVTLPVGP
jgi:signal transduction histidine kinase